jgi:hypothetical protein
MYFQAKNTLKINNYQTLKHPFQSLKSISFSHVFREAN